MRKLAAVILCVLCGQGTVFAGKGQLPEVGQQKQPVINSAAVDSVSHLLIVTGEQFGSAPTVTIDGMTVGVRSGSSEVLVVELPESVLLHPGTYRLSVET